MTIKRDVRKAIESGSTSYAVVEANTNDLITVRVIGSESRITNLEYIGTPAPQVGDKVILDYSAGNKPVIRMVEGQTLTGLINYNYMGEDGDYYEMQDPNEWGDPDEGIHLGGIDVGMACTIKPSGFYFPNEPHDKQTEWIQYWGVNAGDFKAAVYDTMSIYGDLILFGAQYFTISTSGKYLLTVNSNLNLAGGSYGASPYGYMRARIFRLGAYGPYAVMAGVAGAEGYSDYYNLNMSKLIYLPEGEQLYLELLFSGDVIGYAASLSSNPLEWLSTQNELIFKIQLISEAYVLESSPEIPVYEGLMRNWGSGGGLPEPDFEGSALDITTFNAEVIECLHDDIAHGGEDWSYQGTLYDGYYYYFQQSKLDTVTLKYTGYIFQIDPYGNVVKHVVYEAQDYDVEYQIGPFNVYGPQKVVYNLREYINHPNDYYRVAYMYDFSTDTRTEIFREEEDESAVDTWHYDIQSGSGIVEYDGNIYYLLYGWYEEYNYSISFYAGSKIKVYFINADDTGDSFEVEIPNDFDGVDHIWPGDPSLSRPALIGTKVCWYADYGWVSAAQKFISIDLNDSNALVHADLSSNFSDYQSKVAFAGHPDYIANKLYTTVYRFATEAAGETGHWEYDIDTDTFSYNSLANYGYNTLYISDSDEIYWATMDQVGSQALYPDFYKMGSPGTIIDVGSSQPCGHLDNLDEIIWAYDHTGMAIYGYDDDTGTPSYTIDLSGTAIDDIPATGTITSTLSLITGEFFLIVKREVDPGDYIWIYCFIIKRG